VSLALPRHRRGASPLRCARCRLLARLCLCASLVPLDSATRVVVVASARELLQPTNTGRLVPLVLLRGEVRRHDDAEEPLEARELREPARRTVLLFPAPGAPVLAPMPDDPRPLTLVVPDGTWRHARRMVARAPALAGLERVQLPPGPPSRYRLRSHPDALALATLEAVARALGILEGAELQARLEALFLRFVEHALRARGTYTAATGIYSGRLVTRAEPSSS
jgi:tRNA-uridine aminocarboxypropyltransferase